MPSPVERFWMGVMATDLGDSSTRRTQSCHKTGAVYNRQMHPGKPPPSPIVVLTAIPSTGMQRQQQWM
jgi:hypothetical protein